MKKIIKNTIVIITVLSLIGIIIFPIISIENIYATSNIKLNSFPFNPNWNVLYVGGNGPGNYTKIQDAIDNSSNGDLIFVYNGIYHENIKVYNSISLIGEKKESTIIYGDVKDHVVNLTADWIKLSGFTIEYSGEDRYDAGIFIKSNNNIISDNILSSNQNGFYLKNASNNTISNNIVSENYNGITLDLSKNTTIINNLITKNKDGIDLSSNSNSTNIIYNNISENEYDGIFIKSSSNNSISTNKFTNNYRGLWLYDDTNNNDIIDNEFFNDGLVIKNSFENKVTNNTVNNEPILYLEDESNLLIEEDKGQIILVNCNNISIINQTISNVYLGITLLKTKSCLLTENNLANNINGLNLHYSNNNVIINNKFNSNSWNSIYLSKSIDNEIIKNQIISTEEFSGIDLWDYSNNTVISRNNFSDNAYGVHVYNTSNTNISMNNFTNDHYGVCLWFLCRNTTIFSNKFQNCRDGIWSYYAKNNNISENIIKDSQFDGIWLYNSSHNAITDNSIINCTCGIEIANSNSNIITDNILQKGGFFVYYSFENIVFNNFVNGKPLEYLENKSDISIIEAGQVILIRSSNITVKNQDLIDTIIGIQLWWADTCHISGNTVSNNYHGSWIIFSNNNSISNNNVSNNEKWGIYIFSSNDNKFSKNEIKNVNNKKDLNFNYLKSNKVISKSTKIFNHWVKNDIINTGGNISNNLCGMTVIVSKRNDISGNTIESNKDHGILLYQSNENSISENTICQNNDGIIIENSNSNTLVENIINGNNDYGLNFVDSNSNMVSTNTISNNFRGVFYSNSSENTVLQNNFVKNEQNAYFDYCKNKWNGNYWDRPRLFPKLIFGRIKIGLIELNWFNVDWRPAIKRN